MSTPNRLAGEASPYLLQHAHNPVAWWPWGPAALAEARARDVPILLSIGYSACHWCHVMERESFEDEAIAGLMNELFVNVKVDREERPDLDQIYQLVVQLMGRSGGWPLTVFLTPEQKPFFGGTYFPPEDRYGVPGFPKVLRAISDAYRERRAEVEGQAAELTDAIATLGKAEADATDAARPPPDLLARAATKLLARFDPIYGGYGRSPKFPNTMPLEVLLRRGAIEGDAAAANAARLQLVRMQDGGIWDHLGGGFHRYSTDQRWLVPHFEKMLYDNALLLRSYVDAFRAFGEPSFAETARGIARYVAREMTDPDGGYFASQDADSEGEEGKFFVWDEDDVRAAVAGEADVELLTKIAVLRFGITKEGNFEDHSRQRDPSAPGENPKTVLSAALPLAAVAASAGLDEARAAALLERARAAMFDARERRPKPFRDEKILTSWASLLVSAMAEAGAALDEPDLVASAERAFAWIVTHLTGPDHEVARLAKRGADGVVVKRPGFLDDYAYLANAALDLYEASGDPANVAFAERLATALTTRFWTERDGFFFTPADGEALIVRSKDSFDHAVPSGASMACRALLRLGALVDPRFGALAEAELTRLGQAALDNPFGYGQTLCELDRVVRGATEVVLVGPRKDPRTRALARAAFSVWLPARTIAWLDPADPASRAACTVLAEGKEVGTAAAAYVCRGRTCSLPVTTPEALLPLLR